MISQVTATNPRPKLPLVGVQDQAVARWWPCVLWVVRKKDARTAQTLGGDLGPASPCVPGACQRSDYPICKLQSRLSVSASEIRDPYLCLLPPEPELNLVQTLWHHRADYWGNLFLCWERREEGSDDFQLRGGGREKGTHNNNNKFPPRGWREETQAHLWDATSLRKLWLMGQGVSYWRGGGFDPVCFFSRSLVM